MGRHVAPEGPEDARRNADRQAVEFGVETGEYSGVVRVQLASAELPLATLSKRVRCR